MTTQLINEKNPQVHVLIPNTVPDVLTLAFWGSIAEDTNGQMLQTDQTAAYLYSVSLGQLSLRCDLFVVLVSSRLHAFAV